MQPSILTHLSCLATDPPFNVVPISGGENAICRAIESDEGKRGLFILTMLVYWEGELKLVAVENIQ